MLKRVFSLIRVGMYRFQFIVFFAHNVSVNLQYNDNWEFRALHVSPGDCSFDIKIRQCVQLAQ